MESPSTDKLSNSGIYRHMKHLRMFENWRRSPSSPWPQRKHSRGVKVIRVLDPNNDPADMAEVREVIKQLYNNLGYYKHQYARDGEFKIPEGKLSSDLHAAEIMRPDGKVETIVFDDLEIEDSGEGYGWLPGDTVDGKYRFDLPAEVYAVEPGYHEIEELHWDELEWSLAKKK